jgi:hypothetical protein
MASALLYNLARMSTSTTGTGTITLGSAVPGFLTFALAGVQDADTVTYAIKDGTASEIGRGVYTSSGTTLTRSVLKSTNSDAALNLSGSAEVFITAAAEDFFPFTLAGSYTPTLRFGGGSTGITYSSQSGRYTTIGNVCIYSFDIRLSSKGSSTGAAEISLPVNVGGLNGSGAVGQYRNMTSISSAMSIIPGGAANAGWLSIETAGGGGTAVTNSNFTNTTIIAGTVTYFVS